MFFIVKIVCKCTGHYEVTILVYMYVGVVKESQEWVEPIVSKQDLQKAFKDYIKPPSIIEKVQKLSEFVSLELEALFVLLYVTINASQTSVGREGEWVGI